MTEGSVTFRAAKPQADGARPLVEPPKLSLRIDRSQARERHRPRRRAARSASLCRARSHRRRLGEGRRRPGGAPVRCRRDDAAGAALLQSARARPDRAAADPRARRQQPAEGGDRARRAHHRAREDQEFRHLSRASRRLPAARQCPQRRRAPRGARLSLADGARDRGRRHVRRRAAPERGARGARAGAEGRRVGGGDRPADGRAPPGDAGIPAELHGGDGASAGCRTCRRCRPTRRCRR